jgi:ornithine cyclodeaminase
MQSPYELLVLAGDDVARLLPMCDCIDIMAATLAGLAAENAVQPLRTVIALPDGRGSLYTMPAHAGSPPALAVKLVTVFPGNESGPLPTHQGVVVLFDAADGRPVALIDAAEVTAIRTAAVSAVATSALANGDAGDLALIGAGVQARTHLEAMLAVRPIRRVRVWSRTADRAHAFAQRESRRHGIRIEPVAGPGEAVDGADLICTVSAASSPVIHGDRIAAGAHINAVGASTSGTRELDTTTIVRARVFVDQIEAALAEAGDLILPIRERAIGPDHILGALGGVLAGAIDGRIARDDITVFKSLGLAVEDAAAAGLLYERASAGPLRAPSVRMPPRTSD